MFGRRHAEQFGGGQPFFGGHTQRPITGAEDGQVPTTSPAKEKPAESGQEKAEESK